MAKRSMKLFDEILYKRSDSEEKTLFTMKYTNIKFLKEFNHYHVSGKTNIIRGLKLLLDIIC